MKHDKKIALVTGGNRGIGAEVCRELARKGYAVYLGARDKVKGEIATEQMKSENLDVTFLHLDVSDDASVLNAAQSLQNQHSKLNALVNCAGIFADSTDTAFSQTDLNVVRKTLEVNTYGPIRTMKAFASLLAACQEGRIVNVSSGMGQLSEMGGNSVAYRVSKTALNALTKIAHNEFRSKGIKVNSACPGWVKTDMGGSNATRSVSEGAAGIVWLATLAENGPSGGFYRDGKSIAW